MSNIDKTTIKNIDYNAAGSMRVHKEDLELAYVEFGRPIANVIKFQSLIYVSFENAPNFQFVIEGEELSSLSFVDYKKEIDANSRELSLMGFLYQEFTQGNKVVDKIFRFISTSLPVVAANIFFLVYGDGASLASAFEGILASISILVTIFSLFTVSHEHLERKKLSLFESGKLGYYFSVDLNITKVGIIAVLAAIFGIILSSELNDNWNWPLSFHQYLLLVCLDFSLGGTYLVLRSIIEFYIHRPAKFIMGQLKDESLANFDRD